MRTDSPLSFLDGPMGGENVAVTQAEQGSLTKAQRLCEGVELFPVPGLPADRSTPDEILIDDFPLVVTEINNSDIETDVVPAVAMDTHQKFSAQVHQVGGLSHVAGVDGLGPVFPRSLERDT